MANAYADLREQLKRFDGLTSIEVSEAEEDGNGGSVLPAVLSLGF